MTKIYVIRQHFDLIKAFTDETNAKSFCDEHNGRPNIEGKAQYQRTMHEVELDQRGAGEIKLYHYSDLDDKAKEKAREWYRVANDFPFLEEELTNDAYKLLKEAGFEIEKFKLYYSLTYCQGDGASFTATLKKDDKEYEVYKTSSHYQHGMTMGALEFDEEGNETDAEDILEVCREIAKKLEKFGYEYIETENSDENASDSIIVNEYTFTEDGQRLS